MALAFIAGAVIGAMLGALLVYAYEIKVMAEFKRRVEAVEKAYMNFVLETNGYKEESK